MLQQFVEDAGSDLLWRGWGRLPGPSIPQPLLFSAARLLSPRLCRLAIPTPWELGAGTFSYLIWQQESLSFKCVCLAS